MKAPNGKATNLNELQWVQSRTPAFRSWFGDFIGDPKNASKVVDANGDPMVVYHGTVADTDIIDARGDYDRRIDSKEYSANVAGWFSLSPEVASSYTNRSNGPLLPGGIPVEGKAIPEGYTVTASWHVPKKGGGHNHGQRVLTREEVASGNFPEKGTFPKRTHIAYVVEGPDGRRMGESTSTDGWGRTY